MFDCCRAMNACADPDRLIADHNHQRCDCEADRNVHKVVHFKQNYGDRQDQQVREQQKGNLLVTAQLPQRHRGLHDVHTRERHEVIALPGDR